MRGSLWPAWGSAAITVLLPLLACRASTPTPLDCRFIAAPEDLGEIAGCAAAMPDGSVVLEPATMAALARSGRELEAAVVGDALYYVRSDGRMARTVWFDNGADYFVEGLARTTRDGRIGFMDATLVVRIPPKWDFAFPFNGGVAVVCQECREQKVGEHSEVVGGLWGYIDTDGTEVVPVRFERDLLPLPPGL